MAEQQRPSSDRPLEVLGGPRLRTVAMPRDADPSRYVFGG
jgi:acyl-CoA hydrolase